VAGNPRKTFRKQASDGSLPTPFRCPACAGPLNREAAHLLACSNRHQVRSTRGFFDLWPPDREAPSGLGDTYSTPLGWLYDVGVNTRPLARVAARVEWGADVERMYRDMAGALDVARDEAVLDVPVGGGTSYAAGAPHLEGILAGVDVSPAMLVRAAGRRARQHLQDHVLLARGDATALPLADASVTRVLCFNGLHVIPDKATALREFRRVLRPGGELVGTVLVSDAPMPFSAILGVERLARFFVPPSTGELARLARAAGFRRWHADREGALLFFRGQ
jgi:SAM-dependent methyltransferase